MEKQSIFLICILVSTRCRIGNVSVGWHFPRIQWPPGFFSAISRVVILGCEDICKKTTTFPEKYVDWIWDM
jgi:hypothetical protein